MIRVQISEKKMMSFDLSYQRMKTQGHLCKQSLVLLYSKPRSCCHHTLSSAQSYSKNRHLNLDQFKIATTDKCLRPHFDFPQQNKAILLEISRIHLNKHLGNPVLQLQIHLVVPRIFQLGTRLAKSSLISQSKLQMQFRMFYHPQKVSRCKTRQSC